MPAGRVSRVARMSGTDHRRSAPLGGPAIVLVEPQLAENIGTCARAMLNVGLGDLRLVRPREAWPNEVAANASSGADAVLENARLFPTTAAAIADLNRVYATTGRTRGMVKPVLAPRAAAAEIRAVEAEGARVGILFGPERSGLVNDDVALADTVIAAELNPGFMSLNLAMAVLLIGYEWFEAGRDAPPPRLERGRSRRATREELQNFLDRLERELDAGGFFPTPPQRPYMLRSLHNLFNRADLTDQEVRTLHGVVSALIRGRH